MRHKWGAVLVCLAVGWGWITAEAGERVPEDTRVLATDGFARLTAVNDSARIQLSVVTENRDLNQASEENAVKTKAVMNALDKLAVRGLNLSTSGYSIQPQRDYQARPHKIVGYQVQNTIEAVLEKYRADELSTRVSRIIESAVQQGVNEIQQVSFYVLERELAENDALAEATRRAQEKAKVLAKAAGVRLKALAQISTPGATVRPLVRNDMKLMASGMRADSAAPPMEAGESEITAQVSVVYVIE